MHVMLLITLFTIYQYFTVEGMTDNSILFWFVHPQLLTFYTHTHTNKCHLALEEKLCKQFVTLKALWVIHLNGGKFPTDSDCGDRHTHNHVTVIKYTRGIEKQDNPAVRFELWLRTGGKAAALTEGALLLTLHSAAQWAEPGGGAFLRIAEVTVLWEELRNPFRLNGTNTCKKQIILLALLRYNFYVYRAVNNSESLAFISIFFFRSIHFQSIYL